MKIFLIGMMGSGKSYWCQLLAKKLKCGAYDLDQLIENLEEKTITELFAEDGEEYFRKTESKLLKWFAEKKTFVLATGGGTPCFHNNMEWMNKNGITIWLNDPIEVLVERLKPEKAHRPLIKNLLDDELPTFLQSKLAERQPFYSKAQFTVSSQQLTTEKLLQLIKS
jgi:shikimate kinase